MAENDDDTTGNAGLLRKRDELLAEVRALKAKLAEVTAERDAMAEAKGRSDAELKAITIDRPTDDLLAQVAVLPVRFVRPAFDEHFSVKLDDKGQLQFLTAEGQPVQIEGRQAVFSAEDIRAAMAHVDELRPVVKGSQASGGGATGGGRGVPQPTAKKPEPKPKVASPFGLR